MRPARGTAANIDMDEAAARITAEAADEAGERLDRVLARHLTELSRSRLKSLIEAGTVEIDLPTVRKAEDLAEAAAAVIDAAARG